MTTTRTGAQPDYLTAEEAAGVLRITPWAARSLMRAKKLKAEKPGKYWLTTREWIDAYVQGRDVTPTKPTSQTIRANRKRSAA